MDGPYVVDGNSLVRKDERSAFLNREAAEVYLLLDFLSGRADRSLRPTQDEIARSLLDQRNRPEATDAASDRARAEIENDLFDPTRLVLRTMRIKYPIETADDTFQADATFLVRARDVLNTRASPASGVTIAFTSMVAAPFTRRHGGEGDVAQFAQRAYPQFAPAARWLARWIACMIWALAVVLVLSLAVSAYAAWGKVMLDTLDAVRRDGGATQQQLSTAQSNLVAASQPGSLCDPQREQRPAVCDSVDDIRKRYTVTSFQLASWERLIRGVAVTLQQESDVVEQKQTEQWATAAMTVLSNYLMPVLYGLLGSIAFVLRRHYDRLAAHLLSPRDLRANSIRLALGVLIGGCIGLVYSSSDTAQAKGILGAAAVLSTGAIAFLAGYGVEGVFKALDALITQVFRVNGTDKPPQPAA